MGGKGPHEKSILLNQSLAWGKGTYFDKAPAKSNAHANALLTRCAQHRDLCRRKIMHERVIEAGKEDFMRIMVSIIVYI